MKSPVEKSSDQESGSIGNAQAMKRRSVSPSTIEESLLPIKKRRSGSNEVLSILEMQERKEKEATKKLQLRRSVRISEMQEDKEATKKLQPRRSVRLSEMQEEKEAVETGTEVRNPTKNLQPRRSVRISEMQEEKEAVDRNPTKKLQPRSNASLRIGNAQERNEGKGNEKEVVETVGMEVRNPTKKLQPRSNASLRIGNAQERNKGKGKEEEVVETAGIEVRNPTKKEVEDDARRVTAIIKKWTALRWQHTYSSKSLPISKKFYKLEYKRDDDLRKLLWPGDQAAVDKDGLSVPTVDDKGRRFSVVLRQVAI